MRKVSKSNQNQLYIIWWPKQFRAEGRPNSSFYLQEKERKKKYWGETKLESLLTFSNFLWMIFMTSVHRFDDV